MFVSLFLLVFSFLFVSSAEAASLSLKASSDKVTVGNLVTVNLYLDTKGKVINNAEANIQFSNDLLEVVSVKGSLFTLWVENPNFSNNSGKISFNGGIPDPGYSGSGAKVLTIIVKAKKAGTASLVFSGAAVRENDGMGTDILSGQSSASISIISNVKESETPTPPKSEAVIASAEISNFPVLAISSPTYPDSASWYTTKRATLNWKLPNNTSAVQTLIDNNPNSTPVVKYSPAISSKNISDLSDGIWYFHLRYLVNNSWSKTANFKIQIDSTPPTGLTVAPEKNNNIVTGLKLKASDALSGIDYYNVNIDDQPVIKVLAADADKIIPWSPTETGVHKILITAYDKAGNHAELLSQISTNELALIPEVPELIPFLPGSPIFETSSANVITGENSTTSQKVTVNFKSFYPVLVNIFKLLIVLILLFGWYKYIIIKERLKLIKRRADHLTLTSLIEKANKDLLVLEKAQKKDKLTKNEEKSLRSLKKALGDIETISLQKTKS